MEESYKEHREMGLLDTRKENSGRPTTKELTKEELIQKQQAENEYLHKS